VGSITSQVLVNQSSYGINNSIAVSSPRSSRQRDDVRY
jgi:hypothetical protein